MASSRRAARINGAAPAAAVDPNNVTQKSMLTIRGKVRAWFRGGICYRVRTADGVTYGRRISPDAWAAVIDGSFRPNDFPDLGW